MNKYMIAILILGFSLHMKIAYAEPKITTPADDEAWRYAQDVMHKHLKEDRELTVEEQMAAEKIANAYRSLYKEKIDLTTKSEISDSQTNLSQDNQKNEILAKKLFELKQSLYEFFLDKNFGMDDRTLLDQPNIVPNEAVNENGAESKDIIKTNHGNDNE